MQSLNKITCIFPFREQNEVIDLESSSDSFDKILEKPVFPGKLIEMPHTSTYFLILS